MSLCTCAALSYRYPFLISLSLNFQQQFSAFSHFYSISYILANWQSVSASLPNPRSAKFKANCKLATAYCNLPEFFWQLPSCRQEEQSRNALSGDFNLRYQMDCRKYRSATSNIRDFPQSTPKLLSKFEQSTSGNYEQTFKARAQLDRLSLDCSRCAQQLPKLLYFCPCCRSSSPQNFRLQYSTACGYSFSLQWQFPMWKMRSWYSLSDPHSFPNPYRNYFSSCLKDSRATSNSPYWYSAKPLLSQVSGQSVSSLFLCPYLQLISVRQRVFPKAEYLVSARFLGSRVRTVFSALFSLRWRTRVKRSKSDQLISFSMDSSMAIPLRPLRSIISLVSFIRRNILYAEEQAQLKKGKPFQKVAEQWQEICGGNQAGRVFYLGKEIGWDKRKKYGKQQIIR